jgi:hypothetical protein
VLPPLPTVAPTIPATGGGRGSDASLSIAAGVSAFGLLLVLTARRRRSGPTPTS